MVRCELVVNGLLFVVNWFWFVPSSLSLFPQHPVPGPSLPPPQAQPLAAAGVAPSTAGGVRLGDPAAAQ